MRLNDANLITGGVKNAMDYLQRRRLAQEEQNAALQRDLQLQRLRNEGWEQRVVAAQNAHNDVFMRNPDGSVMTDPNTGAPVMNYQGMRGNASQTSAEAAATRAQAYAGFMQQKAAELANSNTLTPFQKVNMNKAVPSYGPDGTPVGFAFPDGSFQRIDMNQQPNLGGALNGAPQQAPAGGQPNALNSLSPAPAAPAQSDPSQMTAPMTQAMAGGLAGKTNPQSEADALAAKFGNSDGDLE